MSIPISQSWIPFVSLVVTVLSIVVTVFGIFVTIRKRFNDLESRLTIIEANSKSQLDLLSRLIENVDDVQEKVDNAIRKLLRIQDSADTLQQGLEKAVVPTLARIYRLSRSAECWSFLILVFQGLSFMLIVLAMAVWS